MNEYIGNWFCKYVTENSQEIETGMEVLTTLMQLVSETLGRQNSNSYIALNTNGLEVEVSETNYKT